MLSALDQTYEYMFGKAVLVAPVTEPKVNVWKVYLPKSVEWYDFWTGKLVEGGQTIKTEAPIDRIPLYIKSGSIIPLGPDVQYAVEKKWDDLEIRIYKGADGEFVLYEDENDNYNYEKGLYSTIKFKWIDSKNTLNIEKRNGTFPGMLKSRTFKVVVVSTAHGTGIDVTDKFDKIVKYDGSECEIILE